jgi:hypothetical protein
MCKDLRHQSEERHREALVKTAMSVHHEDIVPALNRYAIQKFKDSRSALSMRFISARFGMR